MNNIELSSLHIVLRLFDPRMLRLLLLSRLMLMDQYCHLCNHTQAIRMSLEKIILRCEECIM